jgi:hypothetical protein
MGVTATVLAPMVTSGRFQLANPVDRLTAKIVLLMLAVSMHVTDHAVEAKPSTLAVSVKSGKTEPPRPPGGDLHQKKRAKGFIQAIKSRLECVNAVVLAL